MLKTTKESYFFGALILVAITLPFSNLLINTLSIWLMIASWLLSSPIKEKISLLRSNKLIWLFLALFVIYAIGLTYGNFNIGLFEMEKKLSLLIFPIVLGTAPQISSRQLKLILLSFAVSCIVISIICLASTLYYNYLHEIVFSNNRLFFADITKKYGFHPSYFSIYLVFSIFIFLLLFVKNEKISKLNTMLLVLAIIYLIIFIFLLTSRIGLISLMILSVSTLLFYFYKSRRLLLGMSVTLLFIVTVFFTLQFFTPIKLKFKGIINKGADYSESEGSTRLDLWESAFKVIKENVLLGEGTGNFQEALQNNYIRSSNAYYWRYNSHNQFLETAGTVGVAGILSLLLCLFYPLYLCYKNKNYLYAVFLVLFVFISFVECTLAVQKGVVWYAYFNSLFAFYSWKGYK